MVTGIPSLLHRLTLQQASGPADGELLQHFIDTGDEASFALLVRRHGPMVLAACRRLLQHEQDAEDAFQATFLVLARKAPSVVPRSLLGPWLYGVACKTARKARAMREKRRILESRARRPEAETAAPEEWAEALDAELERLPQKYRVPLVLCELQGKTLRQAADLVGCPVGTIASRLARGRALLGQRLRDRDLAPMALAPATLPSALAASTARAAALYAAGINTASSATVLALTEGVLKMMLVGKLRFGVAVLLLSALGLGAGVLRFAAPAAAPPPVAKAAGVARRVPVARSGEDELQALAKKWAEGDKRFHAAVEKEKSPQKQEEAARQFLLVYDAREVEALFAVEKRHRGKPAGLYALNFVVMRDANNGIPDTPLARGRERALGLLRDHYLRHEDLDASFHCLKYGPILFGGEELLKAVSEKSPHEHVRAAALYYWAQLLAHKAAFVTNWKGKTKDKHTLRMLERLGKFDVMEARMQAERLAKRVLAEYPMVEMPYRDQSTAPDAFFKPRRLEKDARSPRMPSYAELAERLLVELRHPGQKAPPFDGRDSGEIELEALAKKWAEGKKRFDSALEKETSPQKQEEAARRFLPAYDAREVEALFAIEKRHRGKPAGLYALNFVVIQAGQFGDPDIPLTRGRERALVLLREHYLRHEDLDVALADLHHGPILFGGEELLKAVSEKSPHEHVRAAALYYGAQLLARKATFVANCKTTPKLVPASEQARWMARWEQRTLERLGKFDVAAARKDAERLAKRVLAEYPKVDVPVRAVDRSAFYKPQRLEKAAPDQRTPTYAKRAERLLFELRHLSLGQKAPSFEGRDANGKPFRLADLEGKVVVLMFSAGWCGPCTAMYPELRELKKKFADKPFTVVTVMADPEVKTVRAAIEKGDITWPAVWDGQDGPIASRWNVNAYPTLYVLDRRGTIRSTRALRGEDLAEFVGELLKEAR
jgi:RNA polymerase sigma factor (sigma-70 family)